MSERELSALPDRTGVVAGYRAWHLEPDPCVPVEKSLRATIKTNPETGWRCAWNLDNPTRAACNGYSGGCDDPPRFDCNCGLHAHFEPYTNVAYFDILNVLVYGGVLAWGRIIKHEHHSFFRSRNMLPIAFMELPSEPEYLLIRMEAEEKLRAISERLYAPVFRDPLKFEAYVRAEAERW